MKIGKLYTAVIIVASMSFLTGFGLGDLDKKVLPNNKDCDKAADPKKCRKGENIKSTVKVVAIGIAAKIIHDMVIGYNSSQTSPEEQVVNDYKKQHKALPADPQVVEYKSSVKPGEIVKAGQEVLVASTLIVVPSEKSKTIDIQEKIEIFDNDNNKEIIKSFSKPVNEKTKKSGAFKNEFKFTLPAGMPQGVYPIKTAVLVDGKLFNPNDNKMQIVLNVDHDNQYEIVALKN